MKRIIADINELRDQSDLPDGDYSLKIVNVKELLDKYPDKVVDVIDRERDTLVVMDTCRLIIKKKKKEIQWEQEV
tara:strand:+ start:180 stop:404 length:225 start_codon:yes stop_codon:yes gene_type:complete